MDLIKAFLQRQGSGRQDGDSKPQSKESMEGSSSRSDSVGLDRMGRAQSKQQHATTTPSRSPAKRMSPPKKPMTWETRDKRIQNPIFALADIKDPEGEVLRPTPEQMRKRLLEEKFPIPRNLEYDPCYLDDPKDIPDFILENVPKDISAEPFNPIAPLLHRAGRNINYVVQSVLMNALSFQQIMRVQEGSTWQDWREADLAAKYGHIDLLKWKEESGIFIRYSRRVLEWAAESGNLELVEWLIHNKKRYTWPFSKEAMTAACRCNHYRMVEWLHFNVLVPTAQERAVSTSTREANKELVSKDAMNVACKNGNWPIMLFLHKRRSEGCGLNAMDDAARNGHYDLVRWLHFHGYRCSNYAMNNAALNGHLEIFEWLALNRSEGCSHYASMYAAQNNHIHILEWMYTHMRNNVNTRDTINFAARWGGTKAIKWLHANHGGADDPSYQKDSEKHYWTNALDWACMEGHLEIVEFLHFNRSHLGGCTKAALTEATANGHLKVVEFLHKYRSEGMEPMGLTRAAANGHLGVVEWFHKNFPTMRVDKFGMDGAAREGHLEMVKFLHHNRSEGCSHKAMDWASHQGHLQIVEFLQANRSEGCTTEALDMAASTGNLQLVEFLHANTTPGATRRAMDLAAGRGWLHIVEWLHKNRSEGCRKALNAAVHGGFLPTAKYLFENSLNHGLTKFAVRVCDSHGYFDTLDW
eukprot:CAMPEP_0117759420 /NCGR_PEP_ID=MMETSP0947-20121206/15999_1 /TAXON_ID=44440 /ORGANISM="Chattonella subsalsa, Strain CCMP2191" /LENGTH=696 /DNA_ID=CAMNT_0005579867 /DNA_START=83 /DNA_END=2170 /DNA_ORIENTATION=-